MRSHSVSPTASSLACIGLCCHQLVCWLLDGRTAHTRHRAVPRQQVSERLAEPCSCVLHRAPPACHAHFLVLCLLCLFYSTELDQLNKVYDCCGVPQETNPNEENYWPGVSKLKYFQQFTPKPRKRMLRQMFASQKSQQAVNLLDKLLTLNPAARYSAEQALDHEYFFEEPLPIEPHQHPQFSGNNHEYGSKQKRKAQEKNQQGRTQQQQGQGQGHMGGGGGGGHAAAASAASHSSGMPNPFGQMHVMPHSMGAGLPGLHATNVSAAAPSSAAQHHYDRAGGGGGGALPPSSAALSHPPYPTHGYGSHAPPSAPFGGHHGAQGGAYPPQQQGQYGQRPGAGGPSQQHRGGGDRSHDYGRH